jgi:hypothetical protein
MQGGVARLHIKDKRYGEISTLRFHIKDKPPPQLFYSVISKDFIPFRINSLSLLISREKESFSFHLISKPKVVGPPNYFIVAQLFYSSPPPPQSCACNSEISNGSPTNHTFGRKEGKLWKKCLECYSISMSRGENGTSF